LENRDEKTEQNKKMRYAQRLRVAVDFNWPQTPFNIVLVEPSIPPNTGNISRLCAATGSVLHLVEPLGFDLSEKRLRRAGLDYWDAVDLRIYPNFQTFLNKNPNGQKYYFSTAGSEKYTNIKFIPGDFFIFGNESKGLSDELLKIYAQQICNIPIRLDHVRSLNLSNCAAVVLYEALRQVDTNLNK